MVSAEAASVDLVAEATEAGWAAAWVVVSEGGGAVEVVAASN